MFFELGFGYLKKNKLECSVFLNDTVYFASASIWKDRTN